MEPWGPASDVDIRWADEVVLFGILGESSPGAGVELLAHHVTHIPRGPAGELQIAYLEEMLKESLPGAMGPCAFVRFRMEAIVQMRET